MGNETTSVVTTVRPYLIGASAVILAYICYWVTANYGALRIAIMYPQEVQMIDFSKEIQLNDVRITAKTNIQGVKYTTVTSSPASK